MKKTIIFSLIAVAALGLTGCSSSDSDDNNVARGTTTVLSAQFIDAAVEGLSYSCLPSEEMGFTNQDGYFNYILGDTCSFSVGDTLLGSAQITGTTTPRTLTTIEPDLTNMLRLLQTLDTDEDPSNGITLPTIMQGNIDLGVDFDAQIQGYLNRNNVSNAVVAATAANDHFEQAVPFSFDDNTFNNRSYTFSHPYMEDDLTFEFNANHSFTSSRDESGTWSIQDGILTLVVTNSNIHYDIVLSSATQANLSQYLVHDGTRYAEQELSVTYSVHNITVPDDEATDENTPPTSNTTDGETGDTPDEDTSGETTTPASSVDQALLDLGATVDNTLTTQAIMASGLHYTYGYIESQYDGSIATFTGMGKSIFTTTTSTDYAYDNESAVFVEERDNRIRKSILLQGGVWVTSIDPVGFNFNAAGDASINQAGNQFIWSFKAYDITGLSLIDLNNIISRPFINSDIPLSTTATFSTGSKAYTTSISVDTFTPYYRLSHSQECTYDENDIATCTQENANVVSYYDNTGEVPFTSITDFIAYNTLNSERNGMIYIDVNDNSLEVKASFSTGNRLILTGSTSWVYDEATATYVETDPVHYENGSYEIKTVGTTEILVLTLPEALAVTGKRPIYSMEGGFLREGTYNYAVTDDFDGFFWLNETAAFDLFDFIESYNTLPATPTSAPARSAMRLPSL